MNEFEIALTNALIKLVPERTGLELQPTIEQILVAHHAALVAELGAFAEKYGKHLSTCITNSQEWEPCNCGYFAAITKHKGAK